MKVFSYSEVCRNPSEVLVLVQSEELKYAKEMEPYFTLDRGK